MIRGQTLVASDGYEVCLYPLESIRITQTCHGSTSHSSYKIKNTGLWDVTGMDGDNPKGYIYAPFTGVVKAIIKGYVNGNQTMIQSTNKVHLANGKLDYACFGFAHDNILDIKVGQEVKQGQFIGNCGSYGNVTGVHSHFLIGEGKWLYGKAIPLCKNKNGSNIFYCPNAINIDEMFYKNGIRAYDVSHLKQCNDPYVFNWKEWVDDMDLSILKVDKNASMHQVEITEELINARNEHSTSSNKLGKLPLGVYNVYETYNDGTYDWFKVGNGVWIATSSDWTCYKDYPKTTEDYKEKIERIKEIING